ncbi:metal ABC transporter solute-binding protein, Zn/Mn family [Arcobacter sp. YIC-310]|uniref:metal ABC transporter solute-binding protein, Zn/Mn family n=1 Tax=Arcobacter sp. YIC-310 TaxID=3376632 RepID=UPI003C2A4030
MKKILAFLLVISFSLYAKELTVSILPQKYFVEKIAKDKFEVNVMVKPGFSPATYEPKTSQMRSLSASKAYFSIGVPFEKIWLEKFESANKNMLLVDTSKGIKKIEMQAHEHHDEDEHEGHAKHEDEHDEHKNHEHHDHDHAKHDEHDHEEHNHAKHDEHDDHEEHGHKHTGLDPHVWLDPMLVKVQAKNIYEALVKIDAKNKDFYLANYKAFVKELEALNTKLENILKPYEDKAFMVFHPSWGYFAKRYDLEQISIEVQGKEPKPAQLVELVDEAKKHNIKIVFVAPQFSQKGAKVISQSINGNTSVIDPLSYEWDKNLLKVANEIAKTYK